MNPHSTWLYWILSTSVSICVLKHRTDAIKRCYKREKMINLYGTDAMTGAHRAGSHPAPERRWRPRTLLFTFAEFITAVYYIIFNFFRSKLDAMTFLLCKHLHFSNLRTLVKKKHCSQCKDTGGLCRNSFFLYNIIFSPLLLLLLHFPTCLWKGETWACTFTYSLGSPSEGFSPNPHHSLRANLVGIPQILTQLYYKQTKSTRVVCGALQRGPWHQSHI